MRSHAPGWVLLAGLILFLSAGLAQAAHNFNFNCVPRAMSVPTGQFYQFQVPISAVPPGADSVDVYFEARYPNGWFSQWCQSSTGICFIDDQPIRLSVGEVDSLEIDFFPVAGVPGMGWAQITLRSRVDPLDYAQCTYTLYSGMPVPQPSYVINCSDNITRLSAGTFVQFNSPMRNTATAADELIVIMESQLPPGWFAQFCQSSNGICFIDRGLLSMPPSVQDTLQVDFFLTGCHRDRRGNDTLDVWIDSGSSSRAVIARRAEIRGGGGQPFQCDMYLEGSDQHRGWFQSSLLLSLAGNGAAPFKTVLTHGFMVDADREKISKSKQGQGGYEKPQTAEAYVKKWGADVVRLWVASQDFRNDIIVSEERISKVAETYRVLRNALRYQLSNLYDFDPAKHAVPDDQLTGLDRWILGEFAQLEQEVIAAYDQLRVPRRLSEGQPVRRRRAVGHLSRRGEGPALHRSGEFAAPPLHADRAAPHGRQPLPDAGADAGVHGG